MTVAQKRRITDFFTVSKKAKSKAEGNDTREINAGEDKKVQLKERAIAVVEEVKQTEEEEEEKERGEKEKEENADEVNNDLSEYKAKFQAGLSIEERQLLDLEIRTMEDGWFQVLSSEFTKPYFLELKKFLAREWSGTTPIFPPQDDVYSWTRLTPLSSVKVLVIGQDPYHNYNQAHGLAFSVIDRNTRVPPSLMNIFKAIKVDYPSFEAPKHGDLTQWAKQGVLLLNTVLTVQAHKANSHAKRGWETFTRAVAEIVVQDGPGVVVMAWGKPAEKIAKVLEQKQKQKNNDNLFLYGVHPSPLSAHRAPTFFTHRHFALANAWLVDHGRGGVDWVL